MLYFFSRTLEFKNKDTPSISFYFSLLFCSLYFLESRIAYCFFMISYVVILSLIYFFYLLSGDLENFFSETYLVRPKLFGEIIVSLLLTLLEVFVFCYDFFLSYFWFELYITDDMFKIDGY